MTKHSTEKETLNLLFVFNFQLLLWKMPIFCICLMMCEYISGVIYNFYKFLDTSILSASKIFANGDE